jgi:uncharacterized protein (DUF433 family)
MNPTAELERSIQDAVATSLRPQSPPLRMDSDGVLRVGSTRVTLDTVVGAYRDGASVDEIALGYDTLQLADVHEVLGFYLRHRQIVEAYLASRQAQHDTVRRENEARRPADGIRERLLARRSKAS